MRLPFASLSRRVVGVVCVAGSFTIGLAGCRHESARAATDTTNMHADHAMTSNASAVPNDTTLPADANTALDRLNASPRHGEYVMISTGGRDSLRAWIVYPQRSDPAPVVLVIQEIFGLSPWVRGVADQLAAAGYIAIAPDLLSLQAQKPRGWPDSVSMQDGMAATTRLNPDSVQRWLDLAAQYAMTRPSALKLYGVVGFCWGGGKSFAHATHTWPGSTSLRAAVVYYGESPTASMLANVHAPVLGLYGENDNRITSTVAATDSAMKSLKKTYEPHIYPGAGHGFLRQQGGENGANLKATQQAWPATLAWFAQYLARDATSHQ